MSSARRSGWANGARAMSVEMRMRRRDRRRGRGDGHEVRQVAVLDEVVLAEPHQVEAEPVDEGDLLHRLGVDVGHRVVAAGRAAEVVGHAEAQRGLLVSAHRTSRRSVRRRPGAARRARAEVAGTASRPRPTAAPVAPRPRRACRRRRTCGPSRRARGRRGRARRRRPPRPAPRPRRRSRGRRSTAGTGRSSRTGRRGAWRPAPTRRRRGSGRRRATG